MNKLLFFLLIMIQTFTIQADSLTVLPFTKDTLQEIKQENQDKAFIVIFWSETCGYCLDELAMFGKLHKRFPEIPLVTVATDVFLEEDVIKSVLQDSHLDMQKTWFFADSFPERIYASVDKGWRGELPFTCFFDRNHRKIRQVGIVKEAELIEWMAKTQSLDKH